MSRLFPAEQKPERMPFAFQIRHIKEVRGQHQPRATPYDHCWRPPLLPTQFETILIDHIVGGHREAPDTIFAFNSERRLIKVQQKPERYDSVSIFWCHDTQGYTVLPYDCTERSAAMEDPESRDKDESPSPTVEHYKEEKYCWTRLSFSYRQPRRNGEPFYEVGYNCANVCMLGRHPRHWIPSLLPYSCHSKPIHSDNAARQLTGKLSILLALIAFNETPAGAVQAIANVWNKPQWSPLDKWQTHPKHFAPFDDRGMVVYIYHMTDPSKSKLHDWEEGNLVASLCLLKVKYLLRTQE